MSTLEKLIETLGVNKDELLIDHTDGRLYIIVTDSSKNTERVYLPTIN